MKNKLVLMFLLSLSLGLIGCNKDVKNETQSSQVSTDNSIIIETETDTESETEYLTEIEESESEVKKEFYLGDSVWSTTESYEFNVCDITVGKDWYNKIYIGNNVVTISESITNLPRYDYTIDDAFGPESVGLVVMETPMYPYEELIGSVTDLEMFSNLIQYEYDMKFENKDDMLYPAFYSVLEVYTNCEDSYAVDKGIVEGINAYVYYDSNCLSPKNLLIPKTSSERIGIGSTLDKTEKVLGKDYTIIRDFLDHKELQYKSSDLLVSLTITFTNMGTEEKPDFIITGLSVQEYTN